MTSEELVPKEFDAPVAGETAVLIAGDLVAFVETRQDESVDEDWLNDGLDGTFGSFCRRHSNFVEPEEGDRRVAEGRGRYLSHYEHGMELWFPRGDVRPGVEFRWDGARTAGIWIPKAECLQRIAGTNPSPEEEERLLDEACRADCETYTAWVNGEVHEMLVDVYRLRRAAGDDGPPFLKRFDYRFDEPVDEDSCGAFIGSWDQATAFYRDSLATIAQRHGGVPWTVADDGR